MARFFSKVSTERLAGQTIRRTGAESKRDSDFYHPLDLKQMYSKIAVTGTDKIDDRDAYIVDASSADLGTDKIYFDTQNGLVLRIVGQHHTMEGPATFTEDFSDF